MTAAAPLLAATGLACGYGRRKVVTDVSFTLAAGEVLCLLGPNGIGKTTLFKTLLRLQPALAGTIRLAGTDAADLSRAQMARLVGYVPQAHVPAFPFRVLDMVAMGRTAHLGPLQSPGPRDMEIAEQALEILSVAHLRLRPCTEISGGERQMVLLARALAQKPQILMLDEPTSNLDFGNQIRVLDHVSRLADQGMAVVMTTHDPNQVLRHATKVAAIGRNGVFAIGRPDDLVTPDYLRGAYGVEACVVETQVGRLCLPLQRGRA
ncbi:MAG TPA: ABC transporter ATP-binding protein [Candidatus Sulfotelmatobacter sp.]|jgi:iron complex transport system ATP-binding protein|nr:ABC transporter ATP-binding protein [Candidatus Sulfotelmatobacter sp.]